MKILIKSEMLKNQQRDTDEIWCTQDSGKKKRVISFYKA